MKFVAATEKAFKESDDERGEKVVVAQGGVVWCGREGDGAVHVIQELKVEGLRGLCEWRACVVFGLLLCGAG